MNEASAPGPMVVASPSPVPVIATLVALGVLGKRVLRWRRRSRLRSLLRAVTARHLRTLAIKRRQLEAADGYGNLDLDAWHDHVDYFIAHVVLREARTRRVAAGELVFGTRPWDTARARIARRVERFLVSGPAKGPTAEPMGGIDYETLCAERLRAAGWTVSTTAVTGDQGADLIAEGDGRRIVLQCKSHARPVGNKAVQEAFAALPFHGGDRAAVVSNAAFTRSARQLARTNGVLLLHHDELPDLAARLDDPA